MKRITALTLAAILLTGCGYSQEQITEAENICFQQQGVVKYLTTNDNMIVGLNCHIDNIVYRVSMNTGKLVEGKLSK